MLTKMLSPMSGGSLCNILEEHVFMLCGLSFSSGIVVSCTKVMLFSFFCVSNENRNYVLCL